MVFYKKTLVDNNASIENKFNQLDLSERQLQAIHYLQKHFSITNSKYQMITGVSKRTATRDLNDMVQKNVLILEGSERGRGILYRLKKE